MLINLKSISINVCYYVIKMMEIEIEVPGTNFTVDLQRIGKILDQISSCSKHIQHFCEERKLEERMKMVIEQN